MRAAHATAATLLTLAAAVGLAGLLLGDAPAHARPVTSAASAAAPTARAAAPQVALGPGAAPLPAALDLRPGDVREATFHLDARLAFGEVEALATTVAGRLTVTCYAAGARELLLGQRWEVTHLALAGQDDVAQDDVARDLGVEVLVRVDRRGAVLSLALPEQASVRARNLVRALVAATGLVLPRGPAARWEAPGFDPTGPCVDAYARVDGADVRRARRFTGVHGHADLQATSAGGARLTIAPDGLAARVASDEVVTLAGADLGGGVTLRTTARLERTATRTLAAPPALAAVEAGLSWTLGLLPEAEPGADLAPVAEPRELEPLVALLAQALPDSGDLDLPPEAPRLFLELAARLRRDPAAVARAVDLVRGAALPRGARATLIDALGEAATPAAQRALIALARDPLVGGELTPNVFLALAEPTSPLPESVATLEAVAAGDDPLRAEWATQGLGVLAARADDPALADRLAAGLEQALGRGGEEDRVVLEALGNAGRERSTEALLAYARADDEVLRATAVSALRRLEGEAVDAALHAALDDPSDLVRREALSALGARPASAALGAVAIALGDDPAPEVRLHALEVLTGWLDEATAAPDEAVVPAEALRAVLQRAAQADPDPAVREAAAGLLEGS
ncbi:MAG: HEAT repeat domain-containing protein [Planctomycetes bacterium]|nr:HEAT repeat domain-containing protein [Planctomycetota bacterium]